MAQILGMLLMVAGMIMLAISLTKAARTLSECSFDAGRNDICDWNHVNQTSTFRWSWSNTTTPSAYTGPRRDYTQQEFRGYLFIESSSPRKLSDTCQIQSPILLLNSSEQLGICLTMYTHMMGENMGSVRVNVVRKNGSVARLWERAGDHDNYWKPARLNFYLGIDDEKIEIAGVVGKDHLGDAAIDGVKLESCDVNNVNNFKLVSTEIQTTESPPEPVTGTLPFKCDFEDNRCGFVQGKNNDVDWFRVYGETDSELTGPVVDHTLGTSTGRYMYVESSEPQKPGDRALLISPIFGVLQPENSLCLQFYYHMYGSGIGSLQVNVSSRWGGEDTIEFFKEGDQGDRWRLFQGKTGHIFGPNNFTEAITFLFEATIGTFRSDIAIDDVSIFECAPNYYFTPPTTQTPPYPDGCHAPVSITSTSGIIASDAHYPEGFYPPNSACRWILNANDASKVISLHYDSEFFVESSERCEYDYVRVFDGLTDDQLKTFKACSDSPFPFKGPYCGSYAPSNYVSKNGRVVVEFCSDFRNQRTGFSLTWNATEPIVVPQDESPNCVRDITLSDYEHQFIKFPLQDGFYENNQRCTVRLSSNASITINTGFFDLENSTGCENDRLIIVDACDNSAVRRWFCGNMGPVQFRSKCTVVLLTFVSDSSDVGTGFELVASGNPCTRDNFDCAGDGICIPESKVCNGYNDCPSHGDEDSGICDHIYTCGREYPISVHLLEDLGQEPPKMHAWHVAIVSRTRRLACSGSIIHRRWILTSAQCVNRFTRLDDMIIIMNSPVLDFSAWPVGMEVVPDKVIIHPSFSSGTIRSDIALLRFTPPAGLNLKSISVCLPSLLDDTFIKNGTKAVLGGFRHVLRQNASRSVVIVGETEPDRNVTAFADTVDVTIMDPAICNSSVENTMSKSDMLCTTSTACEVDGDLGAPLVVQRKNTFYLVGLYSFSSSECRQHPSRATPAIYTRIKSYTTWISDVLAQDAYNSGI